MSTLEESIDVNVPVRTAYNQWTQFESFPDFMSEVESITQTDDTHTHWVANVAGVTREFDAEITEQYPDERIAWRSVEALAMPAWSPSTSFPTRPRGPWSSSAGRRTV